MTINPLKQIEKSVLKYIKKDLLLSPIKEIEKQVLKYIEDDLPRIAGNMAALF